MFVLLAVKKKTEMWYHIGDATVLPTFVIALGWGVLSLCDNFGLISILIEDSRPHF